jgi:PEP-CTERM/exosortase A-associated glycosyltransferase
VLNAIPALRVGKRLGIPVVYEVRAFWEDAAVDHGTAAEGSLRYRLTRRLETHALRRASHVFTICEGLRCDIVGRGIAPEKITVIPNAVDIDSFEPGGAADHALMADLGLVGCTVLGYVGSFYAYEGLDLLLAALPGILRSRPDVRVLLVGGGPQDEALRAQARQLDVADKVVFTGRVPHAEVRRYYDLIDLLVYPRHSMRLTELVTPLKPLEAMAQGRLLIASDVGGHKELIRHGETGWLFKAGCDDALAQAAIACSTCASAGRPARAGREFVGMSATGRHRGAVSAVYGSGDPPRHERVRGSACRVDRPPATGRWHGHADSALVELLEAAQASVTLIPTNAPYRPAFIGRWPGVRAAFRLVPYLTPWGAAGRCELVHVMANSGWSWHLFAGPAIWVARLRGVPVVVNYRGGEAATFLQSGARWVRASMHQATRLVVPSAFLQQVFARHGMTAQIVRTSWTRSASIRAAHPAAGGLPALAGRAEPGADLRQCHRTACIFRCAASLSECEPDRGRHRSARS